MSRQEIGLTDDVRWSLTNAGIGTVYHDKKLSEFPDLGPGMFEWLKVHGDRVKQRKLVGIAFTGLNLTPVLNMLARTLHLNGVGTKVLPLVRMRRYVMDEEFREEVDDTPVLFLTPAMTELPCPLTPSMLAEVEHGFPKSRLKGSEPAERPDLNPS